MSPAPPHKQPIASRGLVPQTGSGQVANPVPRLIVQHVDELLFDRPRRGGIMRESCMGADGSTARGIKTAAAL